jgi:hypothetical protein
VAMDRPQVNVPDFAAQNGGVVNDDDDAWARQYLMIDGCDLLGKLHMPEVHFSHLKLLFTYKLL